MENPKERFKDTNRVYLDQDNREFELKENQRNFLYFLDQYDGFQDENDKYYNKDLEEVQKPEDSDTQKPTLPKFDVTKEELIEALDTYPDAKQCIKIEFQGLRYDTLEGDIVDLLKMKDDDFDRIKVINNDDKNWTEGYLNVWCKENVLKVIESHQKVFTKSQIKETLKLERNDSQSTQEDTEYILDLFIENYQTILDDDLDELEEILGKIGEKEENNIVFTFQNLPANVKEEEFIDFVINSKENEHIEDKNYKKDFLDVEIDENPHEVFGYKEGTVVVSSKKAAAALINIHLTVYEDKQNNNEKYLVSIFKKYYDLEVKEVPPYIVDAYDLVAVFDKSDDQKYADYIFQEKDITGDDDDDDDDQVDSDLLSFQITCISLYQANKIHELLNGQFINRIEDDGDYYNNEDDDYYEEEEDEGQVKTELIVEKLYEDQEEKFSMYLPINHKCEDDWQLDFVNNVFKNNFGGRKYYMKFTLDNKYCKKDDVVKGIEYQSQIKQKDENLFTKVAQKSIVLFYKEETNEFVITTYQKSATFLFGAETIYLMQFIYQSKEQDLINKFGHNFDIGLVNNFKDFVKTMEEENYQLGYKFNQK